MSRLVAWLKNGGTPVHVGAVIGVCGTLYGVYRFGNVVFVPSEQVGIILELGSGKYKETLITSGYHFLPLSLYVQKEDQSPSGINVAIKCVSSDQQTIPVTITAHNYIKGKELPHLAQLYSLPVYREKFTNEICQKEASKLLGQYTLIEWIEEKEFIQSQLAQNIKAKLEEKLIICPKVELEYDVEYIRRLFSHFYTEDQMKEKRFYKDLQLMAQKKE